MSVNDGSSLLEDHKGGGSITINWITGMGCEDVAWIEDTLGHVQCRAQSSSSVTR
jgi:hypothetical protein